MTIQFCRIFWLQSAEKNLITKCGRLLLKSALGITKYGSLLIQSASGITKCDRLYYKVHQILQSVIDMMKWDVTPPLCCYAFVSYASVLAKRSLGKNN